MWSRKLAWRCFLCAFAACFTQAQLHPRMQSGMLSFRGLYPLTNLQARLRVLPGAAAPLVPLPCPLLVTPYCCVLRPPTAVSAVWLLQWLIQLPFLVIASAGGGLLGSLFNLAKRRARSWRQRHRGIAWRLAEAAAVALLTAAALTLLPAWLGTCLQASTSAHAVQQHSVQCRCWAACPSS